jgi:hypothetical protein
LSLSINSHLNHTIQYLFFLSSPSHQPNQNFLLSFISITFTSQSHNTKDNYSYLLLLIKSTTTFFSLSTHLNHTTQHLFASLFFSCTLQLCLNLPPRYVVQIMAFFSQMTFFPRCDKSTRTLAHRSVALISTVRTNTKKKKKKKTRFQINTKQTNYNRKKRFCISQSTPPRCFTSNTIK